MTYNFKKVLILRSLHIHFSNDFINCLKNVTIKNIITHVSFFYKFLGIRGDFLGKFRNLFLGIILKKKSRVYYWGRDHYRVVPSMRQDLSFFRHAPFSCLFRQARSIEDLFKSELSRDRNIQESIYNPFHSQKHGKENPRNMFNGSCYLFIKQ